MTSNAQERDPLDPAALQILMSRLAAVADTFRLPFHPYDPQHAKAS